MAVIMSAFAKKHLNNKKTENNMKKIIAILALTLFTTTSYSAEHTKALNISCDDFSWDDVQTLVQPYLDDVLYNALIMQGQSSNYDTSEAAKQAMDDKLPDAMKRILQSIIDANC